MTEPIASDKAAHELTLIVSELVGVPTRPQTAWTVKGLCALSEGLDVARAQSERASTLHADAFRLVGVVRRNTEFARQSYQDEYDTVVERDATKLSHLSWDERASLYRVRSLDKLKVLRTEEYWLDLAETLLQQTDVLAKRSYRSKQDIIAQVQIMRAGESLGEFGRAQPES